MTNRTKKYSVTIIMIVICAAVYALEMYLGGSENSFVLVVMGARFNPAIEAGEIWRFVTPIFLHIGPMHLLLNLVSLLVLGRNAERIYGSGNFLLLFLLSGISGNIASYIFNPDAISAGASTSIYGIMGSILVLLVVRRTDPYIRAVARSFVPMAVIIIPCNFMPGSGVDVAGHMGGLACGLVLGAILARKPAARTTPVWSRPGSVIGVATPTAAPPPDPHATQTTRTQTPPSIYANPAYSNDYWRTSKYNYSNGWKYH